MENPAPKRRRTSPQTSVPVVQEKPQETSAKSNRPSYASPTRASLGRYNPEILQRRESQFPQDSPDVAPRAATPDSTGLSQALKTQLELRSVVRDANIRGGERSQAQNWEEVNANRATSQPLPPGDQNPFARRGLRRSPVGSVPEQSERPTTELPVVQDPFAKRGLRRSPLASHPEPIVPEPDLPPTPERPDPVVSTPPSGIHNTPSRRPKRNRALAEKIKSSSPLKQPPLKLDDVSSPVFNLPKKGQTAPSPPTAAEPSTAELRGLKPIDPDADKKKLRDTLLAEITALEKDLAVASAENDRLLQAHLSKQTPSPPPHQQEILDLLARHALPPSAQKKEPQVVGDWLSSALNPISFLPFNKPGTSLPLLSNPPSEEIEKPIISHHPIPMSTKESLPFLQIFSPLRFSSSIFPLPNTKPLLQNHFISVSSEKKLFSARIEMTVNTKTLGIVELFVPKMDPNAVVELTPFINKIIKRDDEREGIPSSSGLYNNISVLTWGMAEWTRVSVQRAKVWSVLEGEVKDKERLRGMVRDMRESKRKKRKKRRRRDEDDSDNDDEEEEEKERNIEARELLPYMGKTCLDLEVPSCLGETQTSKLRVVWKIHFDWTGEARSELGVLVGVPGKWHKYDERGQLSGIPRVFDELIQGGEDPLNAMRTVVSLLYGEERA
ncbi:hypothetical protein QBC38DRAFT_253165 [Podospora fimiseda]|uniref:Uncharacterized protein n=1 Tax=Podospora fimiseda TaxID=252190 RepID=A0AAN7BLX7_9PEZI|nr:hypothetical protein QBC38DRAFT_253165 [Podospora fimiseda]